jgi:dTDP-L-oleandrosyltransferase
VTYALIHEYADLAREIGLHPVLFKSRKVDKSLNEFIKSALALPHQDPRSKALMESLRQHFFADATEIFEQVYGFYKDDPPDLILYDRYSTEGRILSSRFDCPSVQISAHFAYYKNYAFRENGVCINPESVLEGAKEMDSFLASHGVKTKDNYWRTEDLNIHFIPKAFQYNSEYFDDRFCFVGALLNRPFRRSWENKSNGKPIILICGISGLRGMKLDDDAYYRKFIDGLSSSNYHCILSIQDRRIVDSIGDLPHGWEINTTASHLEILPHTSIFVGHAGMSSTLEAIYYGVPALLVPHSSLCREIAYRVAELGLGIQLSMDRLSTDSIQAAAADLLQNERILLRVREMQKVFRASGGAALGANRIEALL